MFKLLLMVLISALLTGTLFSYDMLKLGDNAVEYVQKNSIKYKIEFKPFSEWPEGRITFYSYSKKIDGESPVIVFANYNYCIGVLQGKGTNSYYLFDLDGDNVLDTKTTFGVLPYWVILKDSTNRTRKDNVSRIMDELYQAYQDDDGPSDRLVGIGQMISSFYPDVNIQNRDMAYLLDFYLKFNQVLPEQSMAALNMLMEACKDRFNKIPPVIILYNLESSINLGNKKQAAEALKQLLQVDPEYIPAMIYDYQLEKDFLKAKEKFQALKKNYANHWLVKQMK
jgi:hypothetical protein